MSEWWTYTLSDFLMFSPRTYWRLVELYNRDVWPAQLVALAAGLAAIALARSNKPAGGRLLAALLVAAWLWVGWAFHWQRYATINWAAAYFAVAHAVQAALLVVFWLLRPRLPPADGRARRAGLVVAAIAVVLYPLMGWALGRPWAQAEVAGLMPDPTALATLALLLAARRPPAWRPLLAVIPAASLLIGAATLWTMAQ